MRNKANGIDWHYIFKTSTGIHSSLCTADEVTVSHYLIAVSQEDHIVHGCCVHGACLVLTGTHCCLIIAAPPPYGPTTLLLPCLSHGCRNPLSHELGWAWSGRNVVKSYISCCYLPISFYELISLVLFSFLWRNSLTHMQKRAKISAK